MDELDFKLGQRTTRVEIAALHGGSPQGGGMVPAAPEGGKKRLFVFSDLKAGEKHGYTFDGLAEDDAGQPVYHYTGAGPAGDQVMTRGNKQLVDYAAAGHPLHLFVASGKVGKSATTSQIYVGEVTLDEENPYEELVAPGSDGVNRWVYVFHLRPVNKESVQWMPPIPPAATTVKDAVPAKTKRQVPQQGTKRRPTQEFRAKAAVVDQQAGTREVKLREAALSGAFTQFLEAAGHVHESFQIRVAGEGRPIFPDVYDCTQNVLYELKGQASRGHIRTAIGQLYDYSRHIDAPPGLRLGIVLPEEPSADLRNLVEGLGIHLVVQTESGFVGFPLSPVAG